MMKTLTLKHPIPFGEAKITELKFRDYTTAGDYLAFDVRGGVAQAIALISKLSGQDEEVIEALRGPDYRAAKGIVDAVIAADEKEAEKSKKLGETPEKKSQES